MLGGLKQNLGCTRTQRPHRGLSQTCLGVSESPLWRHRSAAACCGDRGSGCNRAGRRCMWLKSSWRRSPLASLQSHRADDPQTGEHYTKEALALQGPQQIPQPGDQTKGLGTPRESDFEGQWDLITELPRSGETDAWRAQTKVCVHQDPGERSSDPARG